MRYAEGQHTALAGLGLIKLGGSRLRDLVQVVSRGPHQSSGWLNGHNRFELLLDGKPVSHMWVNPANNQVALTSELPPKLRGLGLGKKFYGEVIRRMPNVTLESDYRVSQDARRVWRGMEGRGGYSLHEALRPQGTDPIFTASLPAAAALPPAASLGPLTPSRAIPNTPAQRAALTPRRVADTTFRKLIEDRRAALNAYDSYDPRYDNTRPAYSKQKPLTGARHTRPY